MKANYKDKLPKPTTEVTLGNMYEINKQYYAQQEPLTEDEIANRIAGIAEWFDSQMGKYFMLLCNERKDYTIFNLNQKTKEKYQAAAADVIDCMRNRGIILDVELQEDGAFEIWIKDEEESFVYYFFPYDIGVIEY